MIDVKEVDTGLFDAKQLLIDSNLYDREAIFSASYKFTDNYSVTVEEDKEKHLVVNFTKLSNKNLEIPNIEIVFFEELLDQQLRFNLEKRFGHLREIIVRHAFSPIENLRNEVLGDE